MHTLLLIGMMEMMIGIFYSIFNFVDKGGINGNDLGMIIGGFIVALFGIMLKMEGC